MNAHENERRVQVFVVFLLEIPVVFFHLPLKLVVKLHSGVGPRPGASQHGFQGIAEGLLQSFTVR